MLPDLSRLKTFVRRYWPTALAVAMGAVAFVNGLPALAVVWAAAAVALAAMEWLVSRMFTPLDRATRAELREALRQLPQRTWLVDRESDDVLRVRHRRRLGMPAWYVVRLPDVRQAAWEVDDDLAAGRKSTISYLVYTVSNGRVSVHDVVMPVRPGVGGLPEPYDLPGRPRRMRQLGLQIRTGTLRPSDAEVVALVGQLRRAEPLPDEPEEETVDA